MALGTVPPGTQNSRVCCVCRAEQASGLGAGRRDSRGPEKTLGVMVSRMSTCWNFPIVLLNMCSLPRSVLPQ